MRNYGSKENEAACLVSPQRVRPSGRGCSWTRLALPWASSTEIGKEPSTGAAQASRLHRAASLSMALCCGRAFGKAKAEGQETWVLVQDETLVSHFSGSQLFDVSHGEDILLAWPGLRLWGSNERKSVKLL